MGKHKKNLGSFRKHQSPARRKVIEKVQDALRNAMDPLEEAAWQVEPGQSIDSDYPECESESRSVGRTWVHEQRRTPLTIKVRDLAAGLWVVFCHADSSPSERLTLDQFGQDFKKASFRYCQRRKAGKLLDLLVELELVKKKGRCQYEPAIQL